MEVHRTAPAPLSRLSTRCPSITTEDIELATDTEPGTTATVAAGMELHRII